MSISHTRGTRHSQTRPHKYWRFPVCPFHAFGFLCILLHSFHLLRWRSQRLPFAHSSIPHKTLDCRKIDIGLSHALNLPSRYLQKLARPISEKSRRHLFSRLSTTLQICIPFQQEFQSPTEYHLLFSLRRFPPFLLICGGKFLSAG